MAKKKTTKSKTTSSTPKAASASKTVKKTAKTAKSAALSNKKAAVSKTAAKTKKTVKKSTKAAASKSRSTKAAPAAKTVKKTSPKKIVTKTVKSTVKKTTKKVTKPAAKTTKSIATVSKKSKKTTKSSTFKSTGSTNGSPFKIGFNKGASDLDREPLTEDQLRKVKSILSKKDLKQLTTLLLLKRAELNGDVESLRADAKNAGANISYEHMADTGSDNYEQEFTLGLVESERRLLNEIDEALLRIERGYYGVCIETGEPINRERLEAKPWAKYCIEVAREKERHAAPRFRA